MSERFARALRIARAVAAHARGTRGAVVLMYHAVCTDGEHPSKYVVSIDQLRRHLRLARWLGFRPIPLSRLVACLRQNRAMPSRAVVFTFDDGYADNTRALDLLVRTGVHPAVFLVSEAVGRCCHWTADPPLAGRPLLSWDDVRAFRARGVEFGAHTRHHVSLTGVPRELAVEELAGSRKDISERLGDPVTTFAYPFGDRDPETTRLVAAAGFEAACTSTSGRTEVGSSAMEIRRVEVRGSDTLADFARMLWRGHRQPPRTDHGPSPAQVQRHA